jgi:DNA-binding NtrC family response regulator
MNGIKFDKVISVRLILNFQFLCIMPVMMKFTKHGVVTIRCHIVKRGLIMQQETIMIVDDMTSMLEIMKLLFTNAGYKDVYTFDCPLRALHEIDQGIRPDIIISDFNMPDLNGLEFLESAASTLKKVKSVIMSGDTTSIENIPSDFRIIDKGDPEFFKKLLTLIKTLKCSVRKSREDSEKKHLSVKKKPSIRGKLSRRKTEPKLT